MVQLAWNTFQLPDVQPGLVVRRAQTFRKTVKQMQTVQREVSRMPRTEAAGAEAGVLDVLVARAKGWQAVYMRAAELAEQPQRPIAAPPRPGKGP